MTTVKPLDPVARGIDPYDTYSVSWRHYFVALCVFVHMFAEILTFTTLSQYVVFRIHLAKYPYEMINMTSNDVSACYMNVSSTETIHRIIIQEEASQWNIYSTLAICIPSICSNLIFGTYIDKFGRKLLLVSALSGVFLRCLASTLGIYFELDIYLFIAFNVLEGIAGMWIGTLSSAFAYIADVTPSNHRRSFAIAMIEMSLGLGMCLASIVSGFIIQYLGFIYPFGISAGCTLIGILVAIFVLPESTKTNKAISTGVFINIKNALSFYITKDTKRWKYVVCLMIFVLVVMVKTGSDSIYILYMLNAPFCWTSVKIGWFAAGALFSQLVLGISSIKLFQKFLSDPKIALIGVISGIGSSILFGFAPSDTFVYLAIPVGLVALVASPLTRGIMSKMTAPEKQGRLFAGIAAAEAICNLLGNVIANAVYTSTVAIYHGIVYFVLGSFSIIALVLTIILIVFRDENRKGADTVAVINKEDNEQPPSYVYESTNEG